MINRCNFPHKISQGSSLCSISVRRYCLSEYFLATRTHQDFSVLAHRLEFRLLIRDTFSQDSFTNENPLTRESVRELRVTTVSNLHEIWEHKVDPLWLSSLGSSHREDFTPRIHDHYRIYVRMMAHAYAHNIRAHLLTHAYVQIYTPSASVCNTKIPFFFRAFIIIPLRRKPV